LYVLEAFRMGLIAGLPDVLELGSIAELVFRLCSAASLDSKLFSKMI
jgi:hypothetical protein